MNQLIKKENIYAGLAFMGLLLLTIYIPLGLLAFVFLALPFIYLYHANDEKKYIIISVIIIIISMIMAAGAGAFFSILSASVAFIIMKFIKKEGITVTFFYAILAALVNVIVLVVASKVLFDIDFSNYYIEQLQHTISSNEGLWIQLTGDNAGEIINRYTEFINSLMVVLPFILIMIAAIFVIGNYFMATKILLRFAITLPRIPAPSAWGFPKAIIYAYLVVTVLYLVSGTSGFLYSLTLNLFQIFTIVLIIQGISLIYIFIEKRNYNKRLIILAVAAVFLPLIGQLIQVIGIVDLAFDLREKIK